MTHSHRPHPWIRRSCEGRWERYWREIAIEHVQKAWGVARSACHDIGASNTIKNFNNPRTFCECRLSQYRKTPLISTYVFSGLATVQVLIFGGRTYFRGYDKAGTKIQQGRSLFNLGLSVENTLLCMFQRLCTYFQDTGVLIFGEVCTFGALQPTANFRKK